MGELIDDLLTFMHLGRQPIHKVDIKMDELVQQVFNQMTEKESRNIKLILQPMPTAYADRVAFNPGHYQLVIKCY